jgi:hypothetical protein
VGEPVVGGAAEEKALSDDAISARLIWSGRLYIDRRMPGAPAVILVVGDSVFAHGGVLPEHVRRGVDAINAETQAWLRGEGEISPGLLQGDESPLWTRRVCQDPGPADCAVADETLTALGVKRMVVGHTVHKEGIVRNCDGKVWCIDVGMASYYGGHPEALEVVGERVTPLRP